MKGAADPSAPLRFAQDDSVWGRAVLLMVVKVSGDAGGE
jgi:hypothetical protein